MIGADEIEISFDAKAEVGIGFKVNRATWMAATDEEKHKLIAAVVEVCVHIARDTPRPLKELDLFEGVIELDLRGNHQW